MYFERISRVFSKDDDEAGPKRDNPLLGPLCHDETVAKAKSKAKPSGTRSVVVETFRQWCFTGVSNCFF